MSATPPGQATGSRRERAEANRRQRAAQAITEAWPGELGKRVLAATQEYDAFGAVAWKLDKARIAGIDPVLLLRDIEIDDLEWAIEEANNSAAFLASRIDLDSLS